MTYKDIRNSFAQADAIRDAGIQIPAGVSRQVDIPYGPHGKWNLLDVYRPASAGDKLLPVIVSVHGGGWVYGDKQLYQHFCMDMALRGFAVVNFNYRLAPEDPFPAAVEDVNAAFAWTAAHGREYGMDLDKLFVVGDSAGAQLACQYIAMVTDPAFGAMYDLAYPALDIKGAALHCGRYQFDDPAHWTESDHATLMAYFGPDPADKLPLADCLAHITPAFPPTLVMTSYYDFLRAQSPILCQALKAQGVPYQYRLYGTKDQTHMTHVFHLNVRLPEAQACNQEQCDFFRSLI